MALRPVTVAAHCWLTVDSLLPLSQIDCIEQATGSVLCTITVPGTACFADLMNKLFERGVFVKPQGGLIGTVDNYPYQGVSQTLELDWPVQRLIQATSSGRPENGRAFPVTVITTVPLT